MSWRRWKLGVAVAVVLSLFVAGAGLTTGMKWQTFVAVFCAACATHFGSFLKDHPIDRINFNNGDAVESVPAQTIKPAGQNALPAELPKPNELKEP